jgi:hypothetical protein
VTTKTKNKECQFFIKITLWTEIQNGKSVSCDTVKLNKWQKFKVIIG